MNALSILAAFVTSGTFRRGLAFACTSAAVAIVPWINAKLGIEVKPEVMATEMLTLAGGGVNYILQSMSNEKHARETGAAEEAKVITIGDAAKVLVEAGHTVIPPAVPVDATLAAAAVGLSALPGGLPVKP